MSKLKVGDLVIAVAGVLLLVSSFLDQFGGGYSAYNTLVVNVLIATYLAGLVIAAVSILASTEILPAGPALRHAMAGASVVVLLNAIFGAIALSAIISEIADKAGAVDPGLGAGPYLGMAAAVILAVTLVLGDQVAVLSAKVTGRPGRPASLAQVAGGLYPDAAYGERPPSGGWSPHPPVPQDPGRPAPTGEAAPPVPTPLADATPAASDRPPFGAATPWPVSAPRAPWSPAPAPGAGSHPDPTAGASPSPEPTGVFPGPDPTGVAAAPDPTGVLPALDPTGAFSPTAPQQPAAPHEPISHEPVPHEPVPHEPVPHETEPAAEPYFPAAPAAYQPAGSREVTAPPEPAVTPAPPSVPAPPVFAPFWAAVPTPRPIYGLDGPSVVVATLQPGTWYAAVAPHSHGLVVQLQDGATGVLVEVADIFRG